jgi:hypothetical protein
MFEPALRSLRIGGRQVAIASAGDRRVRFDPVDFYHNSSRLIGVDSMKFTPGEVAAIADELRPGFEANVLKPPPLQLVPFENAVEAYESPAARQKQSRCSRSRSSLNRSKGAAVASPPYHPKERGRTDAEVAPANLPDAS